MRRKRAKPRVIFSRPLAFAALAAFAADDCHVSCFSNDFASLLPRRRSSTSLLRADSSGVIAAGGIDGLALGIDVVGTEAPPIMVPVNYDQRIASELTERVEFLEKMRAAEAEKKEHNKATRHGGFVEIIVIYHLILHTRIFKENCATLSWKYVELAFLGCAKRFS